MQLIKWDVTSYDAVNQINLEWKMKQVCLQYRRVRLCLCMPVTLAGYRPVRLFEYELFNSRNCFRDRNQTNYYLIIIRAWARKRKDPIVFAHFFLFLSFSSLLLFLPRFHFKFHILLVSSTGAGKGDIKSLVCPPSMKFGKDCTSSY